MPNEPAKIVLGDTAVTAIERAPGSRRSRRRKDQPRALTQCENCGAQLTGDYCAQCGQAAIDYRRSFRHVIADMLESFLNWDSKFFKTIALLLFQPWKLTNDFLAGHRVRYVNPLRLYLLASILFFFAVNYWAKAIHLTPKRLSPADRTAVEAKLKDKNVPAEVRAEVEDALRSENEQTGQSSPGTAKPKQASTPIVEFADFAPSKNQSKPFEKWMAARAKEKMGEQGTKMD